jgi:hypothetical protein
MWCTWRRVGGVSALQAMRATLLLCLLKRHRVLFLFVWRLSQLMVWYIVSGPFYFISSSFLSFPENYNLVLLVVGISTSIIILLISYFWSWSFRRNFICFQFHLSIQINGNIFFNSVLIILIFNFFSCPFVKLLFFSILPFNQNIVFIFMIILTLILLIFLVLLLIF